MGRKKREFSGDYTYSSYSNTITISIDINNVDGDDVYKLATGILDEAKRLAIPDTKKFGPKKEFATKEELREFLKTAENCKGVKVDMENLSDLFNDPAFSDKPKEFFYGVEYWYYGNTKNIDRMFYGCKNARISLKKFRYIDAVSCIDTLTGTNSDMELYTKFIEARPGRIGQGVLPL